MQDTIDEISEEMWHHILETMRTKLVEFGVPIEREEVIKDAVMNNILAKLENDFIIES